MGFPRWWRWHTMVYINFCLSKSHAVMRATYTNIHTHIHTIGTSKRDYCYFHSILAFLSKWHWYFSWNFFFSLLPLLFFFLSVFSCCICICIWLVPIARTRYHSIRLNLLSTHFTSITQASIPFEYILIDCKQYVCMSVSYTISSHPINCLSLR